MSQDDLKLYVMLLEFALGTATFLNVSMQVLIGELENMKARDELRREIDRMPDGEDRAARHAQLSGQNLNLIQELVLKI